MKHKKIIKQTKKASSALTFDGESIAQHFEEKWFAMFYMEAMYEAEHDNMIMPKLEGRGWYMKDGKIPPVWYVGEQLPPSLTKKNTRKSVNSSKYANKSVVADDDDADDHDDDYIPRKKRPKVCFIS